MNSFQHILNGGTEPVTAEKIAVNTAKHQLLGCVWCCGLVLFWLVGCFYWFFVVCFLLFWFGFISKIFLN